MDAEDIRKIVISFPGVTEEPHFDKTSFRVRGKIFATLPPLDHHVHVFLDDVAVETLVDENQSTFEKLLWGQRVMGVRICLKSVDADLLSDLLEDAWRRKAPKTLIQKLDPN